jgi:hypothetical protein
MTKTLLPELTISSLMQCAESIADSLFSDISLITDAFATINSKFYFHFFYEGMTFFGNRCRENITKRIVY